MAQRTGTYLDRIIADKGEELAHAKHALPEAELRGRVLAAPPVRPFEAALRGPGVRLIAEVKKASPSRGLLRADFDPVALAGAYARGGAAAVSVLTDAKHFEGSLSHLREIRAMDDSPPLLRKDFLFDPYQVYEARANGADAVLLIAAVLERQMLAALLALVGELGMDALVEVHDEAEVESALGAGASLVGINNRDLRTFEVNLATAERLAVHLRGRATVVAESGILQRSDVLRMEAAGANAVLIGEALVTAANIEAKIRELFPDGN